MVRTQEQKAQTVMNKQKNPKGKQLRKPISSNFAPKRLAINFEPPMLIMEYLVVDTGKLYHHKMRLDSAFRKQKVTREDLLNYVKTKHHLYFVSGKVKDAQLLKFIDKLLTRRGISTKPDLTNKIYAATVVAQKKEEPVQQQAEDDFQYLNDQDGEGEEEQEYYDEDYQDYEDPNYQQAPANNHEQKPSTKNAFMTYAQQEEEEGDGHAQWDLDLDENDDFV